MAEAGSRKFNFKLLDNWSASESDEEGVEPVAQASSASAKNRSACDSTSTVRRSSRPASRLNCRITLQTKAFYCISTHNKWLSVNALTGKAAFVRTGNRL